MKQLTGIEQDLKKCVKCGACRAHCPAFAAFQREPSVARGKVALAQAVLAGSVRLDERTYQDMSKCLLCGTCVAKCPNDVPVDGIVIAARAALAHARGTSSFHRAMGRAIRHRRLLSCGAALTRLLQPVLFRRVPTGSGLRLRFAVSGPAGGRTLPRLARRPFLTRHPEVTPGRPDRPRVAYFVGCMTNFVYPEIGDAALALLRHVGCTVIIPRDQQCCGLPALSGGDMATVRILAERNLAVLERIQADYLVTACATCGGALQKLYPEVLSARFPELTDRLQALAARTVDVSELLLQLGLDPAATGSGPHLSVTYHDPCHLRNRSVTHQPRQLLRGAGGVEFLEMSGSDQCCGLGGTFSLYHPEASQRIAEAKGAAIRRSGAQVVATGCPGCMLQLTESLGNHAGVIRVRHTLEILARALQAGR